MFATKHSFRRIFQDLQYLRTVAPLQGERAKNQRFWCAAEVLASEPRAAASPQALARVRDDFWKFAQEVSPLAGDAAARLRLLSSREASVQSENRKKKDVEIKKNTRLRQCGSEHLRLFHLAN